MLTRDYPTAEHFGLHEPDPQSEYEEWVTREYQRWAEQQHALHYAPAPHPHTVAVLRLAAHLHQTPNSPCRTRGGRVRAPHRERHDAAKDER